MQTVLRRFSLIVLFSGIFLLVSCGHDDNAPPATVDVLSVGGVHNLLIKAQGTVLAWGKNESGQLGDNTTTDKNAPLQIGTDSDWADISAGALYMVNTSTFSHSVAVKRDGTLWSWGYNAEGQLGDGNTTSLDQPAQVGSETDWDKIYAGGAHNIAMKTDGALWAWGRNTEGQLGDGSTTDSLIPVQVAGGATNWDMVSVGSHHTVAIKTNGALWAWGDNTNGQLGDGSNTARNVPTQIGAATNWQSVSAGGHTLAIRDDGTLWAWGSNSNGQLGDGTTTDRNVPVQVGGDDDWRFIAAGGAHSLAIKTDGSLWAWGNNTDGRLGDGTLSDRYTPVRVGSLSTWTHIYAGGLHTIARQSDNTYWAWGGNDYGQLGDGTMTEKTVPTEISIR